MDLCQQSDVSAFNMLSHNFPSKEQVSFNFMVLVTICSDFGAQENKVFYSFHCFPIYLPWSDGTGCHDITFSLTSFTFIKRLFSFFAVYHKGGVICISEVIDISPGNLESRLKANRVFPRECTGPSKQMVNQGDIINFVRLFLILVHITVIKISMS